MRCPTHGPLPPDWIACSYCVRDRQRPEPDEPPKVCPDCHNEVRREWPWCQCYVREQQRARTNEPRVLAWLIEVAPIAHAPARVWPLVGDAQIWHDG